MRFVDNLCWLQIKLLHRIHKESKRRHVRQRAQCIILSYQGLNVPELARIFGKTKRTIYTWLNLWETHHFVGMICTLLIVPLFFLSSPPSLLYFSGLSVLLLIWLVGMVDAYIDDEALMGKERWLIWEKLLSILLVAVMSVAVVILMMLWSQDFLATSERLVAGASLRTATDVHSLPDKLDHTGISVQSGKSEFFSVQVGSFRDLERAEEVYLDLLFKGYTATIEQAVSADEVWHRVLVGKFSSEQDAVLFTKKLYEREGFSNMVVRRRSAEKESDNPP